MLHKNQGHGRSVAFRENRCPRCGLHTWPLGYHERQDCAEAQKKRQELVCLLAAVFLVGMVAGGLVWAWLTN